jgi:hypothetical protein
VFGDLFRQIANANGFGNAPGEARAEQTFALIARYECRHRNDRAVREQWALAQLSQYFVSVDAGQLYVDEEEVRRVKAGEREATGPIRGNLGGVTVRAQYDIDQLCELWGIFDDENPHGYLSLSGQV